MTVADRVTVDLTISRKQLLMCAWCGALVILLVGGGLLTAGLWPPPQPSAPAEQMREFYAGSPFRIRLGLALMMAGLGLIMPWGASIAAMTSRIKDSSSAMTLVQVAAFGVATIIGVASVIGWGVASFRPVAIHCMWLPSSCAATASTSFTRSAATTQTSTLPNLWPTSEATAINSR